MSNKLFTPVKVGAVTLSHRIVMAPMTRCRADQNGVHNELAVEYYGQRASEGGLLFTEGTFIAEEAGGIPNVPGIYSEAQIAAWRKVTDAVHAKGGFIFLQLYALGRAAHAAVINAKGHKVVSASDIPKDGGAIPEPLTKEGIRKYVQLYATAAKNAVHQAGFDGAEIHNANGYLPDQFLQSTANNRTDEYGGNIENRSRFTLEIVDAVVEAIGQDRTGIRFSPFGTFQEMRMSDPYSTFTYTLSQIKEKYPDFGWAHMVEPRVSGNFDATPGATDTLEVFRHIWGDNAFICAGGHTAASAEAVVTKWGGAVSFGRWFLANPDLPGRIRHGIPLNPYNRATFYGGGDGGREGYVDYAFAAKTSGKRFVSVLSKGSPRLREETGLSGDLRPETATKRGNKHLCPHRRRFFKCP